jgi:UPF0755 protein
MVRFVIRLIVFLVAVAAMLAIVGAGVWYLRQQGQPDMSITLTRTPADRPPQGVGDWLLSLYLQMNAGSINAPAGSDAADVPFTIEPGEDAPSVATRLEELGLIRDAGLFRRFLQYNGLDASLEAGEYLLRRTMNMRQVAEALQHSQVKDVAITIPEGWRAEQVAELLTTQNIMDGSVFLAAVRQGVAVQHVLLADRPAGMGLEGYLFPETYRLPKQARPEDLLVRMLDTMEARLPISWQGMAAAQGLSFYQLLTVASIVEREAVLADERPTIAGVYLNRVKAGMLLNADPTVQYAMGYQPASRQWWKTPVTIEEYQSINSPFNTYLYPGLPPGPICSPGISSIMAVLQPAPTKYLYFVARGDGGHIFAETLEEQQRNVQQYQGQ